MEKKRWLVSWIGATDHECAQGQRGSDVGPVAAALQAMPEFDRVHLLTNYPHARSLAYCQWLERLIGQEVDLYEVSLSSPIDYANIYEAVSAELTRMQLPREEVELTFHLTAANTTGQVGDVAVISPAWPEDQSVMSCG